MGENGLIGFAEIETETGIPQQTARRYAADFKAWLPSQTVGRAARFKPEVLPTFATIRAGFDAGLTTAQIKATLTAENGPIIDVAGQTDPLPATTDPAALLPILERLTVAVEALAAAQAETVALLREARERPSNCPVEATEDKIQGDARQGEETARKRPFWWRWFSGK